MDFVIPTEMRGLRACKACLLVKSFRDFYETGCENCEFLVMQEDRERVSLATTDEFKGLVGVMQPRKSWVARWNRVANLIPGCYALQVLEQLDPSLAQELEENNRPNLGLLSLQD